MENGITINGITINTDGIAKACKGDAYLLEQAGYIAANTPKIYCVFRHVAKSGMMRVYSFYVVKDGEIMSINNLCSALTHYKWNDKHEGIQINGCGTDARFSVVYALSNVLFKGDMAGYALRYESI